MDPLHRFLERQGLGRNARLTPLRGDASVRRFWRVRIAERRYVVVAHPPTSPGVRRENAAYLHIGRHLRRQGLPVPHLHAWDLSSGLFLVEDFGDTTLQDAVRAGADPVALYRRVIDHLVRMQIRGAPGFDLRWCCQTARYDTVVMQRYEADYFRDAFLRRYLGLERSWAQLDPAFTYLRRQASRAEPIFFLHRDFQSRNIMIRDENLGFLDWQGARLGPLGYDLASLLIDPYTALPPEQQAAYYAHYLQRLARRRPNVVPALERTYPYLAIQRNLQILGAFAFLSTVRGKAAFEDYIPAALRSLRDLMEQTPDRPLDPLRRLAEDLCALSGA